MTTFTEFKAARLKELCAETRTRDHGYVSSDEGDYGRGVIDLINFIKPKSVIEIGSYRGVSTEMFLLHCKSVVAVDPWDYPDTMYMEFMGRCGQYPNLTVCRGKSPGVLQHFVGCQFDMCYIDGDHSYPAVCADIAVMKKLVKLDGFIAGHDFNNPETRQAILECLGQPEQVFCDASWFVRARE